MLLKSVYLKTLRDARIAIAGWGIGVGLMLYTVLVSYTAVAETPAARASLIALAEQFNWLAAAIRVDTPGGYALFKYGALILLVSIWPLLACSRLLRGEEESGALDVLLSASRGRVRVALEKLGAVGTALLAIGAIVGLITYAGGAQARADFTLGDALLLGLDLALFAAVIGALSLFISQFVRERRTATGVTGALLLVFVVLDMVHRVFPSAEWVSRLSPVFYFNESKPLVPSYGTSVSGMAVLAGLTALLTALALVLFGRRDIGGVSPLPVVLPAREQSERPRARWSLRSVYVRSLARIAWPAFWWTLGIAGMAGWLVAIVQQTESQLKAITASSPLLQEVLRNLGGSGVSLGTTLLGSLFGFLPLLLMAFAITQSNRWSSDEDDGRLEMVLATPQPRARVMLATYAAVATATVLVGVVTLAVTLLAASATGVGVDAGKLAAASLSMIPLGLLVAALGYLMSGWLRTAMDTGLLSLAVVAWFVISFVGPELHWPTLTLRLSPFYYYGTPLVDGVQVLDILGLLAAAAVALGLGVVRFSRKDVAI